jgi:uncharacterized membrane-anchored protein
MRGAVGWGVPVSFAVSSIFYGLVLAAVFISWQRTEKTLSIHSVVKRRRPGWPGTGVLWA